MGLHWDAALRNIQEHLQVQRGYRCVGYHGLAGIDFVLDELGDIFLKLGAVFLQDKRIARVEESLANQDSVFSSILYSLDLLDEDEEGRLSNDGNIIVSRLKRELSSEVGGEEADGECELGKSGQVHEVLREEVSLAVDEMPSEVSPELAVGDVVTRLIWILHAVVGGFHVLLSLFDGLEGWLKVIPKCYVIVCVLFTFFCHWHCHFHVVGSHLHGLGTALHHHVHHHCRLGGIAHWSHRCIYVWSKVDLLSLLYQLRGHNSIELPLVELSRYNITFLLELHGSGYCLSQFNVLTLDQILDQQAAF